MKMSDDDLMKITHLLIQEADNYLDEEIAPARAKALRYYKGENPDPLPVVEGRSKMVDTQVRDTIEWIMPDLCRTFAGDDEVVSIEPHGNEDIFDADIAEQWVNYVIMRQNRGFLTTHHWIKDALLSKMGFIKQYWKTNTIRTRKDYEDLTQEELDFLERAEDFEITDKVEKVKALMQLPTGEMVTAMKHQIVPGMTPVPAEDGKPATQSFYDVTGYVLEDEARIIEEPLPPEEVFFLEDTKSIPWDCSFIAHGREIMLGDLREMYPEVDLPDDVDGSALNSEDTYDAETIERFYDTTRTSDSSLDSGMEVHIDPARRRVWFYEIYVKTDRDGDGVAEWVKVNRLARDILEVEEVAYPKIFAITPILYPHRAVGFSLADMTMDLQDLHTALNRQVLDNIYLTNNPRSEIGMNTANEFTLDDYLDNRIGGYIRVDAPGTVTPLQNAQLQPWTFNFMELWEQKRESRTGVSRLNGGLDPDALNKTATGVVQILNQAARRIEQIARIFAETGFRDRVQGILDLSMEYPEYVKGQTLRLTGEVADLDPEKITGRYDLIVNAGIGSGNRDQHAQHMLQLMQVHERMAMQGLGPGSEKQMVTLKNIYNTAKDLINNWGMRNTADYITDPNDKNAEKDPVKKPQPSPEQMKLQQQAEEAKMKNETDRLKIQADREKTMADVEVKRQELALKRRELDLKEWEAGKKAAQEESRVA